MAQRPTLEVVNGGADRYTSSQDGYAASLQDRHTSSSQDGQASSSQERSVARNVHPLPNARTLAIGSGVDPSFRSAPVREANAHAQGESEGRIVGAQPERRGVLLGEIFEHRSESLWPVGGQLVLKLASAIDALPKQSTHDATGGLSRIAVFETGEVAVEGEFPGDSRATKLAGTWLYRFATGHFPTAETNVLPSQVNSNLPLWFDELCMRAVSAEDSAAFPSLRAFIEELDAHKLDVSREEIAKLVRAVSCYLYPSADELAGELGDALRIFTLPPVGATRSRRVPVWGFVAAVLLGVAALIAWRLLVHGA